MGKATVTEALEHLRQRTQARGDLLRDHCAIWLGSGISRGKAPDVRALLQRLVEQLHAEANAGDADAGELLALLCGEANLACDLTAPPASWPRFAEGIHALLERYARVLDLAPRRRPLDRVWKRLDLARLYGSLTEFDAEHRLLAVLVEEGLCSEMVTTNWDALVEEAHAACDAARPLTVAVRGVELPGAARSPYLLKIHGCARKTLHDPATYEPYLVATTSHIRNWTMDLDGRWAGIHVALRALITRKKHCFVGLSLQDDNLQLAFGVARGDVADLWTRDARIYVAGAEVGTQQLEVLLTVSSAPGTVPDGGRLAAEALIPLWAKPLFGALYLECLFEKARALAALTPPGERDAALDANVDAAIAAVERRLGAAFDPEPDHDRRWVLFAERVPAAVARFVQLYRRGRVDPSEKAYAALVPDAPDHIARTVDPEERPYHRLVYLLAGLVLAAERRAWTIRAPVSGDGDEGHVQIGTGRRTLRVLVVKDDEAFRRHVRDGHVDPANDPDRVVFYARDPEPPRGPRRGGAGRGGRLPSRRARREPLRVAIGELLADATARADLPGRLRDLLEPGP